MKLELGAFPEQSIHTAYTTSLKGSNYLLYEFQEFNEQASPDSFYVSI